MTTIYEIAPVRHGWVLQHQDKVLAEFESLDLAARVATVMRERASRAGLLLQVYRVDPGVRRRVPII